MRTVICVLVACVLAALAYTQAKKQGFIRISTPWKVWIYKLSAETTPIANPARLSREGTWRISSIDGSFEVFDLVITKATDDEISYYTSTDSRLRVGNYDQRTGLVNFTHLDRTSVERSFTGRVRADREGRVMLKGKYQGGTELASQRVFFGGRAQ